MRSDVFTSVSSAIPFALVPQENSIFGAVIETNDFLRLPITGRDLFVAGETTLSIQHCLVVRKGVQLKDIETVLSHEQVSRRCSALFNCSIKRLSGLGSMSQIHIGKHVAHQL